MKKFLTAICLVSSVSAFAVEFSAKIEDTKCTIKNGVVTRTQTIGKDKLASFTETKNIKMNVDAALIEKAIETATERPANADYVYTMTHEGKTYTLATDDSKESIVLMRMITRICR